MPGGLIDRRSFLRLCLLAAGGAIAAACEEIRPTPAPIPTGTAPQPTTPSATPTPEPLVEVTLDGGDADAWAWSKGIRGTVSHPDDCERVVVTVNGLDVEANKEGDTLSARLPLSEGENRIEAAYQLASGQEVKSNMLNYTVHLKQRPKAVIRAALENNLLVLDATHSQPDERDGEAILEYIWSPRPGNPAAVQVQGLAGREAQPFTGEVSAERIALSLLAVDGEYYFALRVVDRKGRQDSGAIYVEVVKGALRIPDYDKENPAWVEQTVVYGVIPRNFGSPGFKAIEERLDYLKDLGIDALWLAPVTVSPKDDYGYAIVDYFDLNPNYGSKGDFHRMVQAAHARGIRVLMDFVPNHSSMEHPYYQDTLKNGDKSPYWDFYDRDENGTVTHYFDWTYLPNLNYDNPEVRRWMLEAFSYWVREFDVDGFRVDVAWGIKQRRPDFWPEWRRELKRIKPDLLLLAEASARDPYYFDNGFDAAYDWTDQLGHWAWELAWDSYKHRLLSYNLHAALTNRPDGFHPDVLIFRFLNNNDTGERFITRHGESFTRVATALLLTLPGIPCIYTGDELGEEFRPYYDPAPLSWTEKYPGLRAHHQKLIALRKELPSLRSRLWQPLELKPADQEVYAYLRFHKPFEQPVLVLLNFVEEPAEVEVELPDEFKSLLAGRKLYDLLAEEPVAINPSVPLRVTLGGFGVRMLVAGDENN